MDTTIVVIGGGLAGLTVSLELARSGMAVTLIEKRDYPAHKVCGEYVSNEVRSYLEALGVGLAGLGAVPIANLSVSSPSGKMLSAPLASGGFGISRYALDNAMYELCLNAGVRFLLNTGVSRVDRKDRLYEVRTSDGEKHKAAVVIGAYGKRSGLDLKMDRRFTRVPSPYMAVKYHIRYEHPRDRIYLHNFEDGYCGMSAIEDGKSCLCYLTTRSNLKRSGSLENMQLQILGRNPHLRNIFSEAEFCYEKPLVINEISFQKKTQVENGLIMIGDTAGLITPLCGNGMAIAIHSAKILSGFLISGWDARITAEELENQYQQAWRSEFAARLRAGRMIQSAFGNRWVTEMAVGILRNSGYLTRNIIKMTHGGEISL